MKAILLALFVFLAPALQADSKQERIVPDFALTAVTTEKTWMLRRNDLQGKVWIANFVFTRCHGPCPLNSGKMQGLQKRLPRGILLATFTVDPKHDQAEALRTYAKRFHAEPNRWMFITAPNEEALIPLFKDTFHTAYRPSAKASCGYETYHSAKFFLIDQRGVIRGEYASVDPAQMKQLESDARKLLSARLQATHSSREAAIQ